MGFLGHWSLQDCDYPAEWVKVETIHIAKFVSKPSVKPDVVCEYLFDVYEFGFEDSANTTNMITLLQDMVAECSVVKFSYKIDFWHWGSININ